MILPSILKKQNMRAPVLDNGGVTKSQACLPNLLVQPEPEVFPRSSLRSTLITTELAGISFINSTQDLQCVFYTVIQAFCSLLCHRPQRSPNGGCPIFLFPKAALSPPFFASSIFLRCATVQQTLSKSSLQVLNLKDLLNARKFCWGPI